MKADFGGNCVISKLAQLHLTTKQKTTGNGHKGHKESQSLFPPGIEVCA